MKNFHFVSNKNKYLLARNRTKYYFNAFIMTFFSKIFHFFHLLYVTQIVIQDVNNDSKFHLIFSDVFKFTKHKGTM